MSTMTKRTLLISGLALLCGGFTFAQSAATSDPVTGTWGADGTSFLELKYDGKATVTGTTIWRPGNGEEQRAPIESGSFDPQTGALTLEGSAKDESGNSVRYRIEGKIQNGTASGTFRIGAHKGEFTFTRE
jgi:hypothetical protein